MLLICSDVYEGISGYEEFRDDLVLMYFPMLDQTAGLLASTWCG